MAVDSPGRPVALIAEPDHVPAIVRLGILAAERVTGRRLLPARLLAWYPRAAIGSGVMEAMVAHGEGQVTPRLLTLVRMSASYAAACPFCVDMNSHRYREVGISDEEVRGLRGDLSAVTTFSAREVVAITYARAISATPLRFDPDLVDRATELFTERELVILASTAAQVNYWARLIQALGIPPAGFGDAAPGRARRFRRRGGSRTGGAPPPA